MPLVDLKSDLTFYGRPPGIGVGKSLALEAIDESVRAAKSVAPTTLQGTLQIVKQTALQAMNPNVESTLGIASPVAATKLFNPLSIASSTLGQLTGERHTRHLGGTTYEDIVVRGRGFPGSPDSVTNNRLIRLRNELLPDYEFGITTYNQGPIRTLSAAGGPKGAITNIRRYENTTQAPREHTVLRTDASKYGDEDYNAAKLGIQADTSPLEDTIDNVRVETDDRFANIETYKALTYGQITSRRSNRTQTSPNINWKTGEQWASIASEETNQVIEGKLITFKIGDISFKAYIEDISDNIQANWEGSKDQGRADERYLYTGYDRTVSVAFVIAVETKAEATTQWEKIESLAQLAYPSYNTNGYYNTPVKVTIGDIYKNTPMLLNSVSYDWDNETPWSLKSTYDKDYNGPDENADRPMITRVSVDFTYLGTSKQTKTNAKFG